MKKCIHILLLLAIGLGAFAQKFPEAPKNKLVTDFTGTTLSKSEVDALERKLVAYSDSTSTQITVVIMPDIGGDDINLYTAELAQAWGVGKKGHDNGCMILLSMADRKVSIQNGYGLEPYLTDALSKRIIDQRIIPEFKNGNFYGGLNSGTEAIMQVLAGTFQADEGVQEDRIGTFVGIGFILLMFFFLSKKFGNNNYHRGGGGYWIGGFGSGSSGRGGFGSGGGGFGGFGGGSFGGGGASGGW